MMSVEGLRISLGAEHTRQGFAPINYLLEGLQRRKHAKEVFSLRQKEIIKRQSIAAEALKTAQPLLDSKPPIPSNYPPELHAASPMVEMYINRAWKPTSSLDLALNTILQNGGEAPIREIPSGERSKVRRLASLYNNAIISKDRTTPDYLLARVETRETQSRTEQVMVFPPLQAAAAILEGRERNSSLIPSSLAA